jgi:hypothetical protein
MKEDNAQEDFLQLIKQHANILLAKLGNCMTWKEAEESERWKQLAWKETLHQKILSIHAISK